MRILIATDAWRPQVNGVVSTLERMTQAAAEFGAKFEFLTPQGKWTAPLPTYPDIQVAITSPGKVSAQIEEADPPTVAGEAAYDSLPYAVRASGHQGDGMRTRRHDALAAFDGKIGARAPFRPRAVIEAGGGGAD